MANIYWVGGSGTWDTTTKTNWASASGGVGGIGVPNLLSDVFFDQPGTYTVTCTGGLVCRDLNVTAGIVTFAEGSGPAFTIGGSFNIKTGTIWSTLAGITFNSTSLGNTITTNDIHFNNNIVFNGIGGGWTLGSHTGISAAQTFRGLTITAGTLNTNGYNWSGDYGVFAGGLALNGPLAVLNLSSSTMAFSGMSMSNGVFNGGNGRIQILSNQSTAVNISGGTFNCETSTIELKYTGAGTGAQNGITTSIPVTFYNVLSSNVDPSNISLAGNNTFNNISANSRTGVGTTGFSISGDIVVGSLNIGGAGPTKRYVFYSATTGVQRTITINNSSSLTDVDFIDIAVIGPAAPLTGTRLNDLKGNSGITFPSKTIYWNLAGAQNWSSGWALNSGGTPNVTNLPLAQDTCIFDDVGSVTGTITMDLGYVGTVDMSARTIAMSLSADGAFTSYGNWINGSGTQTLGVGPLIFSGRNTQNITSLGLTFSWGITVNSIGGTVNLLGALTTNSTSVGLTNGTFNLNNYTLTSSTFNSNSSNIRYLKNCATITLLNSGVTIWDTTTTTGLTIDGTPIINCTYSGAVGTRNISSGILPSPAQIPTINISAGTDIIVLPSAVNNINFTGFAGTWNNAAITLYGNLTLASGMTLTAGTNTMTFANQSGVYSGTKTITTAAKTLDFPVTFNALGSIYNLQDAMTIGATRTLTLTAGTVNTQGFNLTTGLLNTTGTTYRTLNMGTGVLTLSGVGTVWDATTSTALFYTIPSIVLSDTSVTARTFNGGSIGYQKLTIGGTTGTSTLTINGSNAFEELVSTKTVAHTILFADSSTQTLGKWSATGTVGNVITINRVTAGTFNLLILGPSVSNVDYLSISNCTVSPLSIGNFYAGVNSANTINNTNVLFSATPAAVTRYWVAGNGTWDTATTTNWSDTSGGSIIGGSISLNGTNQWLSSSNTTIQQFGAGNFTVELWVYLNAIPSGSPEVFNAGNFHLNFRSGPTIAITNDASVLSNPSNTLSTGVWTHIAAVRSSGTMTIYLNGVGNTPATGQTYNFGTGAMQIGTGNGASGPFIGGYFTNIRVTNNAVYTSNFTASRTPLTAITGTALLMDVTTSGTYLTDSSINNFTIVNNNTATYNSLSPLVIGGASVPLLSDDVIFDTSSNATSYVVTIGTTATCANLTMDGPTSGTVTLSGLANSNIYIGSNLLLSGGPTKITNSYLGTLNLAGTNHWTCNTNGIIVNSFNFSGLGSYITLQNNITSNATTTLTAGTVNLNSYNVTTFAFNSNNNNVRNIQFANGVVNLTGANTIIWDSTNAFNFNTTGTPTVNCAFISTSGTKFISGSWAPVNFIASSGSDIISITSGNNFDFTGYTGTVYTGGSTVYGNVLFSSTGSIGFGSNAMTFAGYQATQNLNTQGILSDFPITINALGSAATTLQLLSNVTTSYTRTFTHTAGNLNLNGYNLTTGSYSTNNSNIRNINFGANTITLLNYNATVWDSTTATNMGTTGTPTVNVAYSGFYGTRTITGSTAPVNFNITGGSDILTINSGNNFDFTGFSGNLNNSTRSIYGNTKFSSTMSLIPGTLITTFIPVSANLILQTSGKTLEFPISIAASNTSLQLSLVDNCNVASIRTTTLTSGVFDLNGFTLNTGMFSSTNSNVRRLANSNNALILTGYNNAVWNTTTTSNMVVSNTSNIIVNSSSSNGFTIIVGSTLTNTIFKVLGTNYVSPSSGYTFDFTNFTGTLPNFAKTIYGSWILSPTMKLQAGINALTFAAGSGASITSAGQTMDFPVTFAGVGVTWLLNDNLTLGSGLSKILTVTNGTLNANNFNVSAGAVWSNNSNIRGLVMGSGTWSLTGKWLIWDFATTTNLTHYVNTSSISITDTSTASRYFNSGYFSSGYFTPTYYGGILYNTVNIGGATGNSKFVITGSAYYKGLSTSKTQGLTMLFNNGTNSVENFLFNGSAGNYITLANLDPYGTFSLIKSTTGLVSSNFLNIANSVVYPVNTWYAGSNSVDYGNNTNWVNLSTPPQSPMQFLTMF